MSVAEDNIRSRSDWNLYSMLHEAIHWQQMNGSTFGAFYYWMKHSREINIIKHIRSLPGKTRIRFIKKRSTIRGKPIFLLNPKTDLPDPPITGTDLKKPANLLRMIWFDHIFALKFMYSSYDVVNYPYALENIFSNVIADAAFTLKRYHPQWSDYDYKDLVALYRFAEGDIDKVFYNDAEITTKCLLEASAAINEMFLQLSVGNEDVPYADRVPVFFHFHRTFSECDANSVLKQCAEKLLTSVYGQPLRVFFEITDFSYERLESWLSALIILDFAINPPLPPIILPSSTPPRWYEVYPPACFISLCEAVKRIGTIKTNCDPKVISNYIDDLSEATNLKNPQTYNFPNNGTEHLVDFSKFLNEPTESFDSLTRSTTYYDFLLWCQVRLWNLRKSDLPQFVLRSYLYDGYDIYFDVILQKNEIGLALCPPLSSLGNEDLDHSFSSNVHLGSWLAQASATYNVLDEIMINTGPAVLEGFPESMRSSQLLSEKMAKEIERIFSVSPWKKDRRQGGVGNREPGFFKSFFSLFRNKKNNDYSYGIADDKYVEPPNHDIEEYVVKLSVISHQHATSKGAGFLGGGKELCREIGEEINERWGYDGMLYVCNRVFELSDLNPGAARELEYAWNGIGEWRG